MKKQALSAIIATTFMLSGNYALAEKGASGTIETATYTIQAAKTLQINLSSEAVHPTYHGQGSVAYWFALNNYSGNSYQASETGVMFRALNPGDNIVNNGLCLKNTDKTNSADNELCVGVIDPLWQKEDNFAKQNGFMIGYIYQEALKDGAVGAATVTKPYPIKTVRDASVLPGEYTLLGQAFDFTN